MGALDELAESISQVGVIEPLVVARRDGYLEVVAGHRRLAAARLAKLVTVPCVIHDTFKAAEEAVMLHENTFREDLNPVDEARFFARLLERVEGDTDRLSELVHERRDYVEARLGLLGGDPDVLATLERGDIALGVAREFNLYDHKPTMRAHLAAAAAGGTKTSVVMGWRKQANEFHRLQLARAEQVTAVEETPPQPVPASPFRCFFCGSEEHIHMMKQIYIHEPCVGLLRSALNLRKEE